MAAAALAPQQPAAPLTPASPAQGMTAPTEAVTVTAQKPPAPFSQGDLSQRFGEYQDKMQAINDATGALQPPKFDAPPPPKPVQSNPLEAWGSAAMILAAAGSLLTRQPLTTAMNAAAGVMKAWKDNDVALANQEFERWKASTELAIKQQNFQMEAYRAALQKAATDQRAATAEFSAYAHAFQDNTAIEAAKSKNLIAMQKLAMDGQKLAERMEENSQKIIMAKAFREAAAHLVQTPEYQKADPVQRYAMLAKAGSSLTDEQINTLAEQDLAGDTSWKTGMSRGAQGQANIMAVQARKVELARERGLSGTDIAARSAEFQGLKAGERTLATTAARIGLGNAEMQQLIPQVKEASAELKRTNYPDLNTIIQVGQRKTGDPALKNLSARLLGLKSAFSQVLTRGGVPTDSARAQADELFSSHDPERVMDAALSAIQSEASAIRQAPGMVRQELRETIGAHPGGGNTQMRGPAPASLHGKPIWPQGDKWVYEDGTEAK